MKKHLFLLAAGALALTACTSEDVVDDVATSRNIIKFDNVVNKPTRAVTDLTYDKLQEFHVFGFYTMPKNPNHAHAIFNDTEVKKDGAVWSYGTDYRYWVPNATYYFFAYSCGNVSKLGKSYGKFSVDMDDEGKEGDGKPAVERVLEIEEYLSDYTHQHDLIFAATTPFTASEGMNDDVEFSFNHLLSKLQAKFTSDFPSEYTLVISNVRLENICNQGNYNFNNDWTSVVRKSGTPVVYLQNTTGSGIEKPEAVLSVKNEKVTIGDKSVQAFAATQGAYVIPNNYSTMTDQNVYLKFNVEVKYGIDKVVSKELTATMQPTWAKGYSYTYNINIDPSAFNLGKISFKVSAVKDWDTPEDFDVDIDKQQ